MHTLHHDNVVLWPDLRASKGSRDRVRVGARQAQEQGQRWAEMAEAEGQGQAQGRGQGRGRGTRKGRGKQIEGIGISQQGGRAAWSPEALRRTSPQPIR